MPEVRIETYANAYQDRVASLILSIQNEEFGIPITLQQQPDLQQIHAFYQVNNGNFWVAKMDDQVVGTIALLDIGKNRGALRKMFVARECRGKEFNIGQNLLKTLMEWAKVRGIVEIILGTTEKFIGAQKFYEKNGFTEIKKESLPKEFPIMTVDVKFYKISILI